MKIEVGDRVVIEADVLEVSDSGSVRLRCKPEHKSFWIDPELIKSVEPAPPGVGDTVTWGTGVDHLQVVAISKTQIVTRWEEKDNFEVNYLPLEHFRILKRANAD